MITFQCVSCFFFGKSSVQFVNCSWRTLQNGRNTYHIYSMSAATNINVHLYLHCRAYLRTANISHFPFENSKVIISQYVVLIFANGKEILFLPTGSTPRVILGRQTPQNPISTSGPGYIWWSIQFDRVVRIKRFSLAEHFTLIPLYTSIRLSSSVVVVIMYFLSSFCPQILLQSRVYPDRYLLFLLALLLTPTFLLLCSCFVFSVTRSSSSPCAYWPSLNIE